MRGSLTFAAAAVVALLLALSTPAGANGPFPIEVVGGSLTTAVGTFDLAGGAYGEPPCEPKPTTLAMSFDGTASSGTWTIGGTRSLQIKMGSTTNWFQADVTYLTGSGGTYAGVGSPPPTATLSGIMGIRIDIHYIGDESDPNCVKSLACRITGAFTVTSGDYTGNALPNPQPADTLDLSSSTAATGLPLQVQNCMPPFNALHGTNATLVQDIVFQ
jgi:hypothetical protein